MNRGFVALMTSIIVSFILLTSIVTVTETMHYEENSLRMEEDFFQSFWSALSCIHYAVVMKRTDYFYTPVPSSPFNLGKGNCYVLNVTGEETFQVNVKTDVNSAIIFMKANVSIENSQLQITDYQILNDI